MLRFSLVSRSIPEVTIKTFFHCPTLVKRQLILVIIGYYEDITNKPLIFSSGWRPFINFT